MVRDKRSPRQLEAVWNEKDMVGGRIVDTMVIIMRTNGCSWAATGGCTMCGYRNASIIGVTEDDLNAQLDQAVSEYRGESFVKIYTSGSFLDVNEIPLAIRERVFREFGKAERILFESRPEYITEESLRGIPDSATIALGMESSNERILKESIDKGFSSEEIKAAGKMIKEAGLFVRTYILLKPLYLSESSSIRSAIESVKFADRFSNEISINPVNVQRGTLTERMWKRGEYRPPWIWSLIEVLRSCSGEVQSRLMSSPSGGGTRRGVHNCGNCDMDLLESVKRFSFSQNPSDLIGQCECISSWKRYMEKETMLGSATDVDGAFIDELTIR